MFVKVIEGNGRDHFARVGASQRVETAPGPDDDTVEIRVEPGGPRFNVGRDSRLYYMDDDGNTIDSRSLLSANGRERKAG